MNTTNAPPPEPAADVYSEDGYYAVIPEWVLDAEISAQAVRLYAVLRRYADQRTMHANPSRKTLAERLKVKDEKVVDRGVADLVRIGAVSVIPRWRNEAGHIAYAPDGDHRERTSNGYKLHRSPVAPPPAPGGGGGGVSTPTPRRRRPHPGGADASTVGAEKGEEPQPCEPQPVEPQEAELEGESHVGSAPVEQPPLEAPDGLHRTCPRHRLVAAPGACGACADYRRAFDRREAMLDAAAAEERMAAEQARRDADRQVRELADAELRECSLCDALGFATIYVPGELYGSDNPPPSAKCLHDDGANIRALLKRREARAMLASRRPERHGARA